VPIYQSRVNTTRNYNKQIGHAVITDCRPDAWV
jgi:hypothetical protein